MLERIIEITDNIRLASLIAVAGIVGALYALVTGEITFEAFLAALAAIPAGAGVLGVARNGANHGTSSSLTELAEFTSQPLKAVEGKVGHVRVGADEEDLGA